MISLDNLRVDNGRLRTFKGTSFKNSRMARFSANLLTTYDPSAMPPTMQMPYQYTSRSTMGIVKMARLGVLPVTRWVMNRIAATSSKPPMMYR